MGIHDRDWYRDIGMGAERPPPRLYPFYRRPRRVPPLPGFLVFVIRMSFAVGLAGVLLALIVWGLRLA